MVEIGVKSGYLTGSRSLGGDQMRTVIIVLLLFSASLCWAQRPLYYDWYDQQQDRAVLQRYMQSHGATGSPHPRDNGTGIFHGYNGRHNVSDPSDPTNLAPPLTGYSYAERQEHDRWLMDRHRLTRTQFEQMPAI